MASRSSPRSSASDVTIWLSKLILDCVSAFWRVPFRVEARSCRLLDFILALFCPSYTWLGSEAPKMSGRLELLFCFWLAASLAFDATFESVNCWSYREISSYEESWSVAPRRPFVRELPREPIVSRAGYYLPLLFFCEFYCAFMLFSFPWAL